MLEQKQQMLSDCIFLVFAIILLFAACRNEVLWQEKVLSQIQEVKK